MIKGIARFGTALGVVAALAAGNAAVSAADAVSYEVVPAQTFPAEGSAVKSLSRVKLQLDRGFGTVGYDWSAEGTRVYVENDRGERFAMVNAVKGDPVIEPEWNLEEIDGSSNAKVHTYKDRLYNDLFTRTLGWNGGDGVFTVGLPDGHVFWTFNDSFYGVVDGATRARGACSFPRNTVMVQTADETGLPGGTEENLMWLVDYRQTTDPNAPGYYKAATHINHPLATSFNDDGIAQDYLYWSGDGTVDANGKLQMLWNGVDNRDGQMIALGTALATYSLAGTPGESRYLRLESINHNFRESNPYAYGSTLWEDEDGHIYLYSSANNGAWIGNEPIVARTVGSELGGDWEYYVPDASGQMVWQRSYPTLEQVQKSGIAPRQGNFTLPWVFKKGNTYYMCAQTYPFGQEMMIMTSEHPWGPFANRRTLIKFPNPLDELQHDPYGDKYRFLYMLNLHPALSRNGEIVISTNTDATDDGPGTFWRNFNEPGSADWYRPFYFRVVGWERLYEDSALLGATDCIEFMFADNSTVLPDGNYRFVCEQGVFGNDRYETEGYTTGVANNRVEINFAVGDGAGVAATAADVEDAAPVYYNMQGMRVDNPVAGQIYIVRRGTEVTKQLMR